MKIVIIPSLIYPRISPRSMRATELAKYFAKLGHEVILYGVLGDFDYTNFTKETGVTVKNQNMRLASKNSDSKDIRSFFGKVMERIFGRYLEYPQIEYLWKIPNILKQEKDIDLLITLAIPFPIHWGAAIAKSILKSNFPKVWISDCGDPYMGNTVNQPPFYFKYLEKFWYKKTDFITVPIEEANKGYYKEAQSKIHVIPQGFDFSNVNIVKEYKPNEIPTFAYAGAVYKGYRDPSNFLNYLCSLTIDFRFIIYTSVPSFYASYKDRLKEKLEIKNYIPRENLLYELSQMDFLINLKNENTIQSPSKLIDYYLSKRPILDISSTFHEHSNFNKFINREFENCNKCNNLEQYNIYNVGNKFLELCK